jgi:type IV secretory pathway TraG/TraD family ATPase VirD4
MRLFVNLGIRGMAQGDKPYHPVPFVLDEFYSLGRLSLIEIAPGRLAGYGLKLCPVIHNLGQLKHLHPNTWEAFIANAGVVQCFEIDDHTTPEYLVAHMGKDARSENASVMTKRIVQILREKQELEGETGKQITFRSGDLPMLLNRIRYDRSLPKHWYNRDLAFGDDKPV